MSLHKFVGLSPERLARIRPAMERHLADDKLSGAVALVARRGEIACFEAVGSMDRENDRAMQPDTIMRIYSMTKPITCVALMTLYEQGLVRLIDPVSRFIPAFADLQVCISETEEEEGRVMNLARPVTVWDLLTHRSGLTYHFLDYGWVEKQYRDNALMAPTSLGAFVDTLCTMPLAFQPGTNWRYSVGIDVAARLVEIISGQPYGEFLHENLFEPLGMVDTGFWVPESKLDRFAAMYGAGEIIDVGMTTAELWWRADHGQVGRVAGPEKGLEAAPHTVYRGGHGLVSTTMDYYRFCQMLLNKGELDGQRILGRKTVELMSCNHLPPELLPIEVRMVERPGEGYGLGFGVIMDVGLSGTLGSAGAYNWGGAAQTAFQIDPHEDMIVVQMAQFQPSGYHLIADDVKATAYQAIVD